ASICAWRAGGSVTRRITPAAAASAASVAAASATGRRRSGGTNASATATAAAAATSHAVLPPTTVSVSERLNRDQRPCRSVRASSPQIVLRSSTFELQTSVVAVVATTDATASDPTSRGARANAGPSPTARNGSAGTRNRGPGE